MMKTLLMMMMMAMMIWKQQTPKSSQLELEKLNTTVIKRNGIAENIKVKKKNERNK